MIMTIGDKIEIELRLDCLLDGLLGAGYCVDTMVCDGSVHVLIYESSYVEHRGRLVSRSEYDLTVLEPGLEEAAKSIHLNWVFS